MPGGCRGLGATAPLNPSTVGMPGQCHRQSRAVPGSLPRGTGIWEGARTWGLQQGRDNQACAGPMAGLMPCPRCGASAESRGQPLPLVQTPVLPCIIPGGCGGAMGRCQRPRRGGARSHGCPGLTRWVRCCPAPLRSLARREPQPTVPRPPPPTLGWGQPQPQQSSPPQPPPSPAQPSFLPPSISHRPLHPFSIPLSQTPHPLHCPSVSPPSPSSPSASTMASTPLHRPSHPPSAPLHRCCIPPSAPLHHALP